MEGGITEERAALCALNRIFGFEPRIGRALAEGFGREGFGRVSDVFRLGEDGRRELLGPFSKYAGSLVPRSLDEAGKELEWCRERGISFTGITEPDYPERLRECEDAPVGLYCRCGGNISETLGQPHQIAVVGTRNLTPYGREWCEKIIGKLADTGEKPVIVSGLAYGTDICAQENALRCGLSTVGVMATGPERIYPGAHRKFAEGLCSTPGCALVTDYPPGTVPVAVNFIRRNRIIAGLSDAVILVESAIKGGGMITARQGFSYDRDILAVPGRNDDPRSQGCNLLIRENVAQLIDSEDSLVRLLNLTAGKKRKRFSPEKIAARYGSADICGGTGGTGSPDDADRTDSACRTGSSGGTDIVGQMTRILRIIHDRPGIALDEVADSAGLGYGRTADLVGRLECDGLVHTDLMNCCRIDMHNCST